MAAEAFSISLPALVEATVLLPYLQAEFQFLFFQAELAVPPFRLWVEKVVAVVLSEPFAGHAL